MSRIAFSYNRYSSPAQADGDSIRRQTELARRWCERNGHTLDTQATYEDRGTSGFHGKHRESGMLRRFLDAVKDGDIPRGSVLLIENMDRLSREKPVIGVNVLTGLLMAGVRVVQLAPDEIEFTEDSDLFTLFRGQMSQARGHDESKTKAKRMSEVWSQRHQQAREKKSRVTTRIPAWLEVRGGTLVKMPGGRAKLQGGTMHLIPERAKVVREIFRLATEGYGLSLIVKHLTQAGVEPWGRGGAWSKAYVYKILTGRAALGEYQPRQDDKAVGEPIPGYYPVAVDADTWSLAQAAIARRGGADTEGGKFKEGGKAPMGAGRIGKKSVSLFSGLLWDAATGERMLVVKQTRGTGKNRQKRRVLVSAGSMEGRTRSVSFLLDVFESSVLDWLEEIDPADVFGATEGESVALAAELARVKQSMDAIVTDLEENGDSPAVLKRLRGKEAEHASLARRLASARLAERRPKAAALAEAKTLIDVAKDEAARLRLRQLLRDSIEAVWVLVIPMQGCRLAAVQIHFEDGKHRDYAVWYQAARRGREMTTAAKSFAELGIAGQFDLREKADAAAMGKLLASIDAATLAAPVVKADAVKVVRKVKGKGKKKGRGK